MSEDTRRRAKETWVLVADAQLADIYSQTEPGGVLDIVERLTNDEARAHERDLVADKPGRAFDSAGQGRHSMEPGHTAKQHLRGVFAHRIVNSLAAARADHRFEQLIIVAAPAMLGELRAHLDAPTAACVVAEYSKELAGQDAAAVAKLIDSES
jgi:protein required for attachment to host cells